MSTRRLSALVTPTAILLSISGARAADADLTLTGRCIPCHKEKTPGLYLQWQHSPSDHQTERVPRALPLYPPSGSVAAESRHGENRS